jgi:hypothetical protein
VTALFAIMCLRLRQIIACRSACISSGNIHYEEGIWIISASRGAASGQKFQQPGTPAVRPAAPTINKFGGLGKLKNERNF